MKFIDYNSPEKDIIKEKFNTIPYMDIWICSIVEGYIYENVSKVNEYSGTKEEYIERYRKKEGESKMWHLNGQLWVQRYYKEGKLDGESKTWHPNGQLWFQRYYKDGVIKGEYKEWHPNGQIIFQRYYREGKEDGKCKWWWDNGQLMSQRYYKEGKLDGEYKMWNEQGKLYAHKIYKNGEVIKDLPVSGLGNLRACCLPWMW